jgi:predicted aconitase with swiveling domain
MVGASFPAKPIVIGEAEGRTLRSEMALSLWGGIDPKTGIIIDHRHDRFGMCTSGRILVLPSEKGSSTGSAVLLELIRTGKSPAAILTVHLAPILALGAIVAQELYGKTIPILQLTQSEFQRLPDDCQATIRVDGALQLLAHRD